MIRPRICSHLAVMKQTVVLGHQWVYSATGFCLLPLRTWICVTVTVRSHLLLKVKHLLCHCLNRSHPWTTELTRNTRLTCGRDGQPSGQGTKAAQLTISVLSVCFAFSVYKEKTHRCWEGVELCNHKTRFSSDTDSLCDLWQSCDFCVSAGPVSPFRDWSRSCLRGRSSEENPMFALKNVQF